MQLIFISNLTVYNTLEPSVHQIVRITKNFDPKIRRDHQKNFL